ncbi:hypothetical protein ACHAXN_005157 [Cyclotella atomus]
MGEDQEVPLIPVKKAPLKKPHMVFGLCDTRRAIVILNILTMILAIPAILLWVKLSEAANGETKHSNIQLTPEQTSMILSTYPEMLATYGITIVASLIALCGASHFSMPMIQVAAFLYLGQMGLSIWQYLVLENWVALGVDVGVTLLWIYPHAVFLWELDSGVLTKLSYEPHCICCSNSGQIADEVQETFSKV